MSQKQVMPKSEDLSRSLEINAIWTFDTEFPTIFNKSCTYITFKSAVKHRQLGYGYPRGQTVHLAETTTQDTAPPSTLPCEARFFHRILREPNPGPSRGSPLYNRCASPVETASI